MKPNEYAYTTMITVRGKAGSYRKAVDLFHEMQRDGMVPTVVTYNAMITACARASDGQGAVKWLQQMEASCVEPDSITYSQVILPIHFVYGSVSASAQKNYWTCHPFLFKKISAEKE